MKNTKQKLKWLSTLFMLFTAIPSRSQIGVGIESGISFSYMRIATAQLMEDEYVRFVTGFPLGISTTFFPWEKINIHTGLKFNPKGVQQKHYNQEFIETRTGYLEIPLKIRLLIGNDNVFWYLEPGASVLYLISYKLNFHLYDLLTDSFEDTTLILDPVEVNEELGPNGYRLSLFDFQISAGTGIQLNIKNWIVSAGLSFEWGLNNFFVIPEGKKNFVPVLNRSAVLNAGVHYVFRKSEKGN